MRARTKPEVDVVSTTCGAFLFSDVISTKGGEFPFSTLNWQNEAIRALTNECAQGTTMMGGLHHRTITLLIISWAVLVRFSPN